jgi:molybdopterin molybdotransferase
MMAAMLRRAGCEVADLGIFRDDPEELGRASADAAKGHDLIVSSGGVSTGEEDHTRKVVEKIGTLVQWRLAIKPGRPVAMAVVKGTPFVGLPGNPVAVFVTFVRVVRPLLLRLSGAAVRAFTPLPVRSAFAYKKKKGRREYVRVALRRAADGEIEAVKHPQDGAGVLTSLTQTDGLLELADDVTVLAPGDRAGFLPYAVLLG